VRHRYNGWVIYLFVLNTFLSQKKQQRPDARLVCSMMASIKPSGLSAS
jgi:hypothetical protein